MIRKFVDWLLSYFGPQLDYLDSLIIEFDGIAYLPVDEGLPLFLGIVGCYFLLFLFVSAFFWISVYAAFKGISIFVAYFDSRRKKHISGVTAPENK